MRHLAIIISAVLLCTIFASGNTCWATTWETGLKTGFDTNVDRALSNEKSDSYLTGYLSFSRIPTGESRFDWLFGATLEGTGYNRYSDLSYGLINVAPGFVYVPHRLVSLTTTVFFEAKAVKDSDQNSLATGGKVMIREQIHPDFYLGQYYLFRTSAANVDTYSTTEHAFGALAEIRLTSKVTGEIGYEYSHGDSYRAVNSGTTVSGHGRGRNQKFSQTFNEFIIREPVDRHAVSVGLNVDWSKSFGSTAGYVYTSMNGDSGFAHSHAGYIGVSYRF